MMINSGKKILKRFNGVSLVLSCGFIVFLIIYSIILNRLPANFWAFISLPFINENIIYYDIEKLISILFYTLCEVLTLITVLIIYLKFRNDSLTKNNTQKKYKLILFGIAFGIFTIIISMIIPIIYGLIIQAPVESANTKIISNEIKSFPISLVTTLFVAPILEEITFKAGIFTFLHEMFINKPAWLNTFLPAVISACVFGFLHDGIALIPIYFIPAFTGCLIYKKTGSLIPCVVGHFMNNLFVTILLFF